MLQVGFNNDEAVLLLTLPFPTSTQFRTLYIQVMFNGFCKKSTFKAVIE